MLRFAPVNCYQAIGNTPMAIGDQAIGNTPMAIGDQAIGNTPMAIGDQAIVPYSNFPERSVACNARPKGVTVA